MAAHQVMEPQECIRRLRTQQALLRAAVEAGEPAAAVPACPGWTLRDLAEHVGGLHRWVQVAILEGHPNAPAAVAPPGPAALLDWLDTGFAALVDLLVDTDPDTPCWTFGPHPRTARFWSRRQLHEHAVHAVDARASQGLAAPEGIDPEGIDPEGIDPEGIDPEGIDPALAADGVDEVVGMFFPRQVRLGRIPPLDRSLAIRPTDVVGAPRWLLAGNGIGADAVRSDLDPAAAADVPAEATVSGPASALYLLLWGRTGLDDPRLSVTGDRTAATGVLAAGIVP